MYFDPYFNFDIRSSLFTRFFPDHGAGWSLASREYPSHDQVLQRVSEYVMSALNVEKYAEVNCPFTGLFPINDSLYRRTNVFKSHLKMRIRYRRVPLIDWTFNLISELVSEIFFIKESFRRHVLKVKSKFLTTVKKFKGKIEEEAGGSHNFDAVRLRHANALTQKVLISIPTTSGWSAGSGACSKFGVSCGLFAQVIPIDFALKKGQEYDLIGFFDTLDHIDSPIDALQKCLKISKAVLVKTHRFDASYVQHQFFLDENFFNALEKLITDIQVVNLSAIIYGIERSEEPNDLCFLIVRDNSVFTPR